jgi:hypothetical protein
MAKVYFLLILLSTLIWAQSDTASLSGTVSDPSNAAIVGAQITVRNIATGSTRVTVSDSQGLYHFSLLVPGQYEMIATAPGFMEYRDMQVLLQC